MGKVIMSGIVPQLEEPISFDPVFANNTWEQIIKVCQKNKVPDTWVVGDQKVMTINGTDYAIDIIGKYHDDCADGSGKAPLTLQIHDLYETTKSMNGSADNSGGWRQCKMRKTDLPAILALMPMEVQEGILEVNKLASSGYSSHTIETVVDKLFLLSEIEVLGSAEYSKSGEGSQYAYYAAGNSTLKYFLNDTIESWWTRSAKSSGSAAFCYIGTAQADSYWGSANNGEGVSFAFCF